MSPYDTVQDQLRDLRPVDQPCSGKTRGWPRMAQCFPRMTTLLKYDTTVQLRHAINEPKKKQSKTLFLNRCRVACDTQIVVSKWHGYARHVAIRHCIIFIFLLSMSWNGSPVYIWSFLPFVHLISAGLVTLTPNIRLERQNLAVRGDVVI